MTQAAKRNEFFTDGSLVKILNFQLSAEGVTHHLGINIQKIKEVVEYAPLKSLPFSYYPFIGLYDLRGSPVPVIHLAHFFQRDETEKVDPKELEGCRIMICEFQKMLIGFVVDKTGKIINTKNSELESVPEALDFTEKRLFNGVLRYEGEFLNLLDVELILDSLHIDLGFGSEAPKSPNMAGKRVLLVEDSRLFQKKLQKFFEKMQMPVVVADDGKSGLEKLKEHNYQFDLVFTDIEMPYLNGIGMVREMKKLPEAEQLPVIFNTSISNPRLVEDIQAENLGEYIVKFDEEEILGVLQKALS